MFFGFLQRSHHGQSNKRPLIFVAKKRFSVKLKIKPLIEFSTKPQESRPSLNELHSLLQLDEFPLITSLSSLHDWERNIMAEWTKACAWKNRKISRKASVSIKFLKIMTLLKNHSANVTESRFLLQCTYKFCENLEIFSINDHVPGSSKLWLMNSCHCSVTFTRSDRLTRKEIIIHLVEHKI